MIRPDEIAFDVDGVFADTMGLFLEIARRDFGINHVSYEDITQYYLEACLDIPAETISAIINNILDGAFQDSLKPIDGACAVLSDLAKKGPLLFVTARPTVSPIRDWILERLPSPVFPIDVVATGALDAKSEVLKARGVKYFVEDCLEVCFSLSQEGLSPIVFCQPWNRAAHPFREVRHWDEIKALIDAGPSVPSGPTCFP